MSCTNKKKILEIEELSVSFLQYKGKTSRQSWLPVISGLSVAVREGELVAVVGSSGSGKSLLAHAILGILPYNAKVSGIMKFQGELMDEKKISELRGKEIAFVPQSTLYLDPLMKVGKQVRGKRGRKGAEKQSELFRRYGLPEKTETKYPFRVFWRNDQKNFAVYCINGKSKLIIADEPTPGMD